MNNIEKLDSIEYIDMMNQVRKFSPPDNTCENCGGTGECETELYEGLTTCWICSGSGKIITGNDDGNSVVN